jgi:GNAT superfamily N-acetyltransferase
MSEEQITVRRATSDDWESLRAIRLESLQDTPEAYGSTYEDSVAWSDERWRAAASHWVYFLAERDGRALGMISGGSNDQHPGTSWMYAMYVTPAARGTATATRLVDVVGRWARDQGASKLYLHVTSSVARARAFYEKVGFRPTGDVITMNRDPSITLFTMVQDLD